VLDMETKKVIIFIEGESNSPNGDLRQGFTKLFKKILVNNLPSTILGDGKSQAIKKFLKNKRECDLALLLIDLDKPISELEQDLKDNNLESKRGDVFYMIQEMESWFLSQPKILDVFYGRDNSKKSISEKLSTKKAVDFNQPGKELKRLTKNTLKGEYHKIRHATELLKLIDPFKLERDFDDFKMLIQRLK
jgi:hypothetical protein